MNVTTFLFYLNIFNHLFPKYFFISVWTIWIYLSNLWSILYFCDFFVSQVMQIWHPSPLTLHLLQFFLCTFTTLLVPTLYLSLWRFVLVQQLSVKPFRLKTGGFWEFTPGIRPYTLTHSHRNHYTVLQALIRLPVKRLKDTPNYRAQNPPEKRMTEETKRERWA